VSLVRRFALTDLEDTAESLVRNLAVVLDAKKGYSAVVEVYGLGDYDGHPASSLLRHVRVERLREEHTPLEPRAK
jgi:hypothetical protein